MVLPKAAVLQRQSQGACPLSLLPKLMSRSKGLTGFAKLLQDAFKTPDCLQCGAGT
ncbi:hypothetical protein LEMLEM_LOCUS4283 [Lemmus lemmus]